MMDVQEAHSRLSCPPSPGDSDDMSDEGEYFYPSSSRLAALDSDNEDDSDWEEDLDPLEESTKSNNNKESKESSTDSDADQDQDKRGNLDVPASVRKSNHKSKPEEGEDQAIDFASYKPERNALHEQQDEDDGIFHNISTPTFSQAKIHQSNNFASPPTRNQRKKNIKQPKAPDAQNGGERWVMTPSNPSDKKSLSTPQTPTALEEQLRKPPMRKKSSMAEEGAGKQERPARRRSTADENGKVRRSRSEDGDDQLRMQAMAADGGPRTRRRSTMDTSMASPRPPPQQSQRRSSMGGGNPTELFYVDPFAKTNEDKEKQEEQGKKIEHERFVRRNSLPTVSDLNPDIKTPPPRRIRATKSAEFDAPFVGDENDPYDEEGNLVRRKMPRRRSVTNTPTRFNGVDATTPEFQIARKLQVEQNQQQVIQIDSLENAPVNPKSRARPPNRRCTMDTSIASEPKPPAQKSRRRASMGNENPTELFYADPFAKTSGDKEKQEEQGKKIEHERFVRRNSLPKLADFNADVKTPPPKMKQSKSAEFDAPFAGDENDPYDEEGNLVRRKMPRRRSVTNTPTRFNGMDATTPEFQYARKLQLEQNVHRGIQLDSLENAPVNPKSRPRPPNRRSTMDTSIGFQPKPPAHQKTIRRSSMGSGNPTELFYADPFAKTSEDKEKQEEQGKKIEHERFVRRNSLPKLADFNSDVKTPPPKIKATKSAEFAVPFAGDDNDPYDEEGNLVRQKMPRRRSVTNTPTRFHGVDATTPEFQQARKFQLDQDMQVGTGEFKVPNPSTQISDEENTRSSSKKEKKKKTKGKGSMTLSGHLRRNDDKVSKDGSKNSLNTSSTADVTDPAQEYSGDFKKAQPRMEKLKGGDEADKGKDPRRRSKNDRSRKETGGESPETKQEKKSFLRHFSTSPRRGNKKKTGIFGLNLSSHSRHYSSDDDDENMVSVSPKRNSSDTSKNRPRRFGRMTAAGETLTPNLDDGPVNQKRNAPSRWKSDAGPSSRAIRISMSGNVDLLTNAEAKEPEIRRRRRSMSEDDVLLVEDYTIAADSEGSKDSLNSMAISTVQPKTDRDEEPSRRRSKNGTSRKHSIDNSALMVETDQTRRPDGAGETKPPIGTPEATTTKRPAYRIGRRNSMT